MVWPASLDIMRETWENRIARLDSNKEFPLERIKDTLRMTQDTLQEQEKTEKKLNKTAETELDLHKNIAETWATQNPQEAAQIYPELANTTALAVVIDKRAEADGLSPAQRAVVAARTKQNIINSIEKGNLPTVNIKAEIDITANRKENELSR